MRWNLGGQVQRGYGPVDPEANQRREEVAQKHLGRAPGRAGGQGQRLRVRDGQYVLDSHQVQKVVIL